MNPGNIAQVFGQVLNSHDLAIHNLTIQVMAMEELLISKNLLGRKEWEGLCTDMDTRLKEIGEAYKSGIPALEKYMQEHTELTSKILTLIEQRRKVDQEAFHIIHP